MKAAAVGSVLADLFQSTMTGFFQANSALNKGEAFGDTGDIRKYIGNGSFIDYPGMNETALLQTWNNMVTAAALNQLYRFQKVFIVGGGPCDESAGLGKGPEEAKYCRDGKLWHLYYWLEPKGFPTLGKARWGHVEKPPGFDELGKGIYADITPMVCPLSSMTLSHLMITPTHSILIS